MRYFLATTKSSLAGFTCEADREYFSKPVEVLPLYSSVATRLLYVRDPARGHVYPVKPSSIVRESQLTKGQRLAAGV